MAPTNSAGPGTMLVLDVDGVITDPETGEVNGEVLAVIIRDLKQHVPVALNTGRALTWVQEKLWPDMASSCSPAELENLFVVAEKGAVVGRSEQGSLKPAVDTSLAPPDDFRAAVRSLVESDDYSAAMFWDAAKLTMISIERRHTVPLDQFDVARKKLEGELKKLISEYDVHHFKLDSTVIATDIQHETAGKHLGADQILIWLQGRGNQSEAFTAIGDSPSDAAMAEVFAETAPTTFVYVGDPATYTPPEDAKFETVVTHGKYASGTAEYLASQA